jgi:error-prone DNA polymerase
MMAAAGVDATVPMQRHWLRLAGELENFPRHLATHPGGFLLGHEPIDGLVPIEPAAMAGRTIIQWDKHDVEDLGLFKVDLLGLGALSHIRGCLDLIREHHGEALTMATVPAEDPATYAMLSRGDTIGVFQVESRAQMAMLPRLRPRTFYDLVIQVAIVRPGPIQGDMVHPYLRRRNREEPVVMPHPSFERVLGKTLGVPLFQEQVMRLAMLAADYTPGEADQLRRDMAAWGAREADRGAPRIPHRRAHGRPGHRARVRRAGVRADPRLRRVRVPREPRGLVRADRLRDRVAALPHPAAFTAALLNAQPMGFYHPSTLIDDAKRHGITVLPIDVRRSLWDCILEPVAQRGWGIRMGLRYVKGLGVRERAAFEAALLDHPFESLPDFVRRVRIPRSMLERLAQAGAFDGFDRERRRVLFELRRLQPEDAAALPLEASAPQSLARFPQIGRGETISWDYKSSLHSARGHPLEDLRPLLEERKIPEARMVARLRNGQRTRVAGLVICRQRPGTATGVTFMTLEDETGFVNIVVWRDVFEKFERVGKMASLLMVEGKVQAEEGVVHVIAETLIDLGEELTREASRSHASPTRASPTRASPTRASIVEKSRDFH